MKTQNLVKNQSREAQPLALSGVGEGAVREGEGSDFAIRKNLCIQAPAPSLKENARAEKGESKADLSAQRRKEIDSANFAVFSQGGWLLRNARKSYELPCSHSLARNDEFLDSSLRFLFAQNDNFRKFAESAWRFAFSFRWIRVCEVDGILLFAKAKSSKNFIQGFLI